MDSASHVCFAIEHSARDQSTGLCEGFLVTLLHVAACGHDQRGGLADTFA